MSFVLGVLVGSLIFIVIEYTLLRRAGALKEYLRLIQKDKREATQ